MMTVTWAGLTLSTSADAPYLLEEIEGWESTPPTRQGGSDRPTTHGQFPGRVLAGARQVIASGYCLSESERDELLLDLQAAMGLPASGFGVDDLVVTSAGRTLTARAQVVGCRPEITADFADGVFPWVAEWVCADPFRYGSPETASTALPQDLGGLRFDLFTDGADGSVNYLDFGQLGTTGRVTVTNPGTAEARPVFAVSGSLPSGFEVVETQTGRRLRYEAPVTASSTVTLDSATGRVRLDTADRGGSLTRAEWWGVPPQSSREVLFQSLSGYVADARLSVTTRPTFW